MMQNRSQSARSRRSGLAIQDKSNDTLSKSRLGLGSTESENIALRRNYREMGLLDRKKKMLGLEQEHVMKMIDLKWKSTQVNYKRLTKRVGRIRSHLTADEIKEMENDARKTEFANKYRNILRNQTMDNSDDSSPTANGRVDIPGDDSSASKEQDKKVYTHCGIDNGDPLSKLGERRSVTSYGTRACSANSMSQASLQRPKTCPIPEGSDAVGEIIPSLEGLLDQLHNIKPQQFYENQRKLKLYDIQLMLEELDEKKISFYREVDAIVNWGKKKEIDEEEEERKKKEEEENQKPRKRKTTFMRTVLRNFSMELMAKTMQYGWTDLGKCTYLRKGGGDDEEDGNVNLTKNYTKLQPRSDSPPPSRPPIDPGFGPDGKMIRTADLLGLKY